MKSFCLLVVLLMPLAAEAGVSPTLPKKLRNRDAIKQANSVDLNSVRRFLVEKQTNWNETRIDAAIAEYRRFLALGIAYGEQYLVPAPDTDEVCEWHK